MRKFSRMLLWKSCKRCKVEYFCTIQVKVSRGSFVVILQWNSISKNQFHANTQHVWPGDSIKKQCSITSPAWIMFNNREYRKYRLADTVPSKYSLLQTPLILTFNHIMKQGINSHSADPEASPKTLFMISKCLETDGWLPVDGCCSLILCCKEPVSVVQLEVCFEDWPQYPEDHDLW